MPRDTLLSTDPECAAKVRNISTGGVDFAFEMAGAIPAMALAYSVGRRGSTTICAGLPPHTATFPVPSSALVADERVIKGSYMGSAVPTRDIPDFVDKFLRGKLPVDRLLTDQIGFDDLNAGFDRLDDGVGVRQVLKCTA